MGIVTAPNGDTLLLYRARATTLDEHPDLPLTFACIVARQRGKTLIVFDSWRQEWELPAGLIEAGETPRAAVIRELYEESGQAVTDLTYAGLALIGKRDGQLELGAMYTGELDQLQPFATNDETSAMLLWDAQTAVDGVINVITLKLIELLGENPT